VDGRFSMEIPKQFVNVNNRPIIVYTMEIFSGFILILTKSLSYVWKDGQEMVRVYAKQFNITKLKAVLPGGKNAQESTYRGLSYLKDHLGEGDVVVVHDSIRPMVSQEIITDSIHTCRKKGMGIAATFVMDAIIHSQNGVDGDRYINRDELKKVQTPQAFDFELLWNIHNRAIETGCCGSWDNSSLLTKMGEKVYFSKGSDLNLKINTMEDVEMFRALYRMYHPETEDQE